MNRRDGDNDELLLSQLRDEAEQLRTALEHADEEITRLVEHRDRLLTRVATQARDLHTMNSAYREAKQITASQAAEKARSELSRSQGEEELRVAFEELQVVTEELETANAGLRRANEELDARVQERTQVIAESEKRLRTAIDVGRLGLWDWDIETGEIHWSDEHYRMEGYEVGEIAPSYEAWASRIHPDDRGETEAVLQEAMRICSRVPYGPSRRRGALALRSGTVLVQSAGQSCSDDRRDDRHHGAP